MHNIVQLVAITFPYTRRRKVQPPARVGVNWKVFVLPLDLKGGNVRYPATPLKILLPIFTIKNGSK